MSPYVRSALCQRLPTCEREAQSGPRRDVQEIFLKTQHCSKILKYNAVQRLWKYRGLRTFVMVTKHRNTDIEMEFHSYMH
jgi:hypothetical protein